jgi:hypothetical protein
VSPERPPASLRRPSGSRCASSARWPEHEQHPLVDPPAGGEQQGAQRIHVGPVRVVDDHHDRGPLRQVLDHVQDPGPDADRFLGRERPVAADQQPRGADARHAHDLVDHAVGDVGLPLLAGGAEHREVRFVGEELLEEHRLADARVALHDQDARRARPGGGELGAQRRDLGGPPDEGVEALGDGHGWCQPPSG